MNKLVVVICGPTASGKTDVASNLCAGIKGEIISADSRQVYRYLDTGTNKSGIYDSRKKLRFTEEGIPQHLTDLIDPDEVFSAGDFVREAGALITSLKKAGRIPVITGGTGLYIKALVNGLAPLPGKNDDIRAELNAELKKHGISYLSKKLKAVDPVSAEANRSNPHRTIRALEVYRLTGKPISYWHANTKKPDWDFVQFAPQWERKELYDCINERAGTMLMNGMPEETKKLFELGYAEDCPGLGSLGYRHVCRYLDGGLSFAETKELIALDTRHYAKRQLTWFRAVEGISWLKTDKASFDPTEMAAGIHKNIKNML